MNILKFLSKVHRRLLHLRLRPIRVFCLHQVCREYDSLRCIECDWMSADSFIQMMRKLQHTYSFISLLDAHKKLSSDFLRRRSYAVLTFDDGYRSNLTILKWLDSNNIPYTLFLNGKYLDGRHCSIHVLDNARRINSIITEEELAEGLYLTSKDIQELSGHIGSHGYEHLDATDLNQSLFRESILKNYEVMAKLGISTIPFHAYTWGRHTSVTDEALSDMDTIPVLMDGLKNYNDSRQIHRELFPVDVSI